MFKLPAARISRSIKSLLVLSLLVGMVACGGGGAKGPNGSTNTPGTPGTPGTPAAVPTLSVSLSDPVSGASKSSISGASPGIVKATVKNADGSPASGVVVTFSTEATLATLSPTSGTALTDANGIATATIAVASVSAAGAATVEAKAQVGTAAVTGSTAFAIGATNVTLGPLTLGLNPLSAFGTTSVSVQVLSNGTPFTTPLSVNFSSGCASNGRAVLTSSVTTINGTATASYLDKGCAAPDTITATLSGISATASATLTVTAPNTGSIQFRQATPTQITLKGTGGAGLQETSEVRFKVLDEGGNPVGGKTVTFTLSTTVGGVSLTSASGLSDPTTGEVVTNVVSGTISTPVRVLATTTNKAGTLLSTQSDQLTITTGVPTQSAFSVSTTNFNIEGWEFDGENTTLTARLADHFGNPPPGGSVVNFVAEGAKINGSCATASPTTTSSETGVCSVLFTSQEFRPANGRVSVLAYSIGEESFTDVNGNGFMDSATELVDSNGTSTVGLGEAFVDYDENGTRSDGSIAGTKVEPFIDFDSSGVYQAPITSGALYKGILCAANSPLCSPSKTLNIRRNTVVVLSGSHPFISGDTPLGTIDLSLVPVQSLGFVISDLHGNAMPAGTTVTFENKNNDIVSTSGSFPVPNTTACIDKSQHLVNWLTAQIANGIDTCPVNDVATLSYGVRIKQPTPPGTDHQGFLKITVKTPKGTSLTLQYDTIY